MHTGILTPFIAGMQPQHTADDSMRDLLEDINEKLQILIEIQQARQPPYYRQPTHLLLVKWIQRPHLRESGS